MKTDFTEFSQYWKELSDSRKQDFKVIENLDKERYRFEKNVITRFEFILRLLRASEPKKFPKINKKVYEVYKEHYLESLKESG